MINLTTHNDWNMGDDVALLEQLFTRFPTLQTSLQAQGYDGKILRRLYTDSITVVQILKVKKMQKELECLK